MTATAAPDDAVGTAAHRRRWSWRAQVLSLLVVVLIAALSVAVGGALYVVRTSVAEETESKALAIARTVAADPATPCGSRVVPRCRTVRRSGRRRRWSRARRLSTSS